MSRVETTTEPKWVVLHRSKTSAVYEAYVHPKAEIPTRFKTPENAVGLVRMLRKRDFIAYAVKETDTHKYGVTL